MRLAFKVKGSLRRCSCYITYVCICIISELYAYFPSWASFWNPDCITDNHMPNSNDEVVWFWSCDFSEICTITVCLKFYTQGLISEYSFVLVLYFKFQIINSSMAYSYNKYWNIAIWCIMRTELFCHSMRKMEKYCSRHVDSVT